MFEGPDHHHYGVTNPPKKVGGGLMWNGVWWGSRVRLFKISAMGARVERKTEFTHIVLLGGRGEVLTDERTIRALPDAPIAIPPKTFYQFHTLGPVPTRWLVWYSDA